ncbi:MAG: hypothetical protein QM756_32505 [Polyangiaceae bacterium]
MHAQLPEEALRCLRDVRWQLLESFALARQEGLAEPVGFVLDPGFPYARGLGQRLLMLKSAGPTRRTVTCMERAQLHALFASVAPDVAEALRNVSDEPGRWASVILAQSGWVLTGSWQELFTLEARPTEVRSRRS